MLLITFKKISFILLLLMTGFAMAQTVPEREADALLKKYSSGRNTFSIDQLYYIAAWPNTIQAPEGVRLIKNLSPQVAVVTIPTPTAFVQLSRQAKVTGAADYWKATSNTWPQLQRSGSTPIVFIAAADSLEAFLSFLKGHSQNVVIKHIDKASQSAIITCTPAYFKQQLLSCRHLIFVDVKQNAQSEANIIGYNRSFHGINAVDYLVDGANGKGVVVGIKEQNMQEADLDLYKRVLPSPIASTTFSQHATVIASIVGGAGNLSYSGRGIANHCSFFSSSFANLFPDDLSILNNKKVSVQNHSYGTVIEQFYGAEALSYDAQCRQAPSLLHVFSSGNRGLANATDGQYANIPKFANLTGNFKMAKNVLTVGAITNTGLVPDESSAGPLYDGRLAPQLIALGPNGTSDAAAIVSGTAAVLQQVYADSNNGNLPPASLVKAILFNTADDLLNPGVDFKTGYGLLNSVEATRAMLSKRYTEGSLAATGTVFEKQMDVPAKTAAIKLTLSWTDLPAALGNLTALQNDLDLVLVSKATGQVYKPGILSRFPNADSLSQPARPGTDSLNTSEQIIINEPPAGTYTIRVTARKIIQGPQVFHVAHAVLAADQFEFTNPLHASDVNRLENANLNIKWRCFPKDKNATGHLYITYNDGQQWLPLSNSVVLNTGSFAWDIKDTAAVTQLKMETAFGIFFSPRFVLSDAVQLNVAYNCSDSVKFFWRKHIFANGYRLYNATDSPYLQLIATVQDTMIALKKSNYASPVFAVEPVLSNSIPAARSVAINADLQGVKCFYKNLNYQLLDENKVLLTVDISDPGQVDSLYFEQVSPAGTTAANLCSTKVQPNQTQYFCTVDKTLAGVTTFRVRIKLKNSSLVYTETIAVTTSGSAPILFYPNPASRNGFIKVKLMQGLSYNSVLRIYDATGRLFKNYTAIPNQISTWNWPSGIYFYRLTSETNDYLGAGKLIVQ